MPALNLRDAMNALDPESALRTDEELSNYFVERPDSPAEDLQILISDSRVPQKFLFTGHRGSGKSTELAKLSQRLRGRFFIIHYSVKDRLNLFDLTHVDVILSLGLEMIAQAQRQATNIKEEVLAHILDFTKEITKEAETGIKDQANVGAELNLYVTKLSAKLGTEDATREVVREKVGRRLSDLLGSIDDLAQQIESSEGRRPLLIVEDLDKADLATAKQLFYDHSTSLIAPRVSVIYTFPTALRHDNDFMQVKSSFPETPTLPNFKTRLRNGSPDEDGLNRLRQLLSKRVAPELFEGDSLGELAESSGGIPRELVALARRACLEARKADRGTVDAEAVRRAVSNRRMEYEVLLTRRQRDVLKRLQGGRSIENDEEHRDLLHNLSLLEYRNDEVWFGVHPVIQPLLKEGG